MCLKSCVMLRNSVLKKRLSFTPKHDHITYSQWSLLLLQRRALSVTTSCFSSQEKLKSTLDNEEVQKFSKLSSKWWDSKGEFAALQNLNALRIPLIRDALPPVSTGDPTPINKPLKGQHILDVGCGGGLVTEPLARLGAKVDGIDASSQNISSAEAHALKDPEITSNIKYKCCLVEDFVIDANQAYDAVVASEILEHVKDVNMFLSTCCQLVKPGGSLFITSLNRTALSCALAVFAAENVFGIVPRGTHDWNKFVTPEELENILQENGMNTKLKHGMLLNPLTLRWSWTKDLSMNYALHAVKLA